MTTTAPADPGVVVEADLFQGVYVPLVCEWNTNCTCGSCPRCDQEASWMVVGPCNPSCESRLMCDEHAEEYRRDTRQERCSACGEVGHERYVRIKP